MIDILIQMSWPVFFIFLILISFLCLWGGRLWINADGSNHYPLPNPTRLTPFEIATLRDGRKGVIQTALFNLWHRQLITIDGQEESAIVKKPVSSDLPLDNRIENTIYQFLNVPRKPVDFFTNPSHLHSTLDQYIAPFNKQLEKLHLKRTEEQMTKAWAKGWIMMIPLIGSSLIKMHFDLYYENPVLVLVLIICIVAITFAILKPKKITELGFHYQAMLQRHFEWMKTRENTDGIDPAYQVAIFGIQGLIGFESFKSFETTFSRSSGCGIYVGGCGGCGGGCGGCGGCGG